MERQKVSVFRAWQRFRFQKLETSALRGSAAGRRNHKLQHQAFHEVTLAKGTKRIFFCVLTNYDAPVSLSFPHVFSGNLGRFGLDLRLKNSGVTVSLQLRMIFRVVNSTTN